MIVFAALLIGSFAFGIHESHVFNNWTAGCIKRGGTPIQTKMGVFSDTYDCEKNGKILNYWQN